MSMYTLCFQSNEQIALYSIEVEQLKLTLSDTQHDYNVLKSELESVNNTHKQMVADLMSAFR